MRAQIHKARALQGRIEAPGDKSLSHRALLFAALADGTSSLEQLGPGADVRSTARCLQAMGVQLRLEGGSAVVAGRGHAALKAPGGPLDCGNSGTSMRLLAGLVAGAGFGAVLDGDESLRGRPMRRVLSPLRAMGAVCRAEANEKGEVAPLAFGGGHPLVGVRHELPMASAQVKSCCLLAGLYAEGETSVREPEASRDHTERMLAALGAPLAVDEDGLVRVTRLERSLRPLERYVVPGDPSSAAFFLAAAALVEGADVEVSGVCVNPTRMGFVRALERMGANVRVSAEREALGEPVADLSLHGGAPLRAIDVAPAEVPALIDEVPILAVLATQASGTTTIRGAGELRVKESDRIATIGAGLRALGAQVEELPDGLVITGPTELRGARVSSGGDHRIAMSLAVAGLLAGDVLVDEVEWVDISFPGFFEALHRMSGGALDVS